MKMTKKCTALLLAGLLLASSAGCGNSGNGNSSTGNGSQQSGSGGNQSSGLGETDPIINDEGIEVYFENISDSITVAEHDWYRGPITSYTTQSSGQTKKTPANTLIYGITGNIQGAYPPTNQQENVWSFNAYESLFRRNFETGELEPWLATDYSYDDEGNMHITLREGVKFHDGNTMTAEDVLYTLKLSHDDPAARAYSIMQSIDFDKSTVDDDTHLTLVFIEPIGSIIDILASGYCHIMSKAFVEKVGPDYPYYEADAGTGPYYLVESVTDMSQTFHRFEDYWGGAPEIETIIAKRYTDQTALFIDYVNGDLDGTFRVAYEDCMGILDGTYTDTTLYRIPNNRYRLVFFNTINDRSPAKDINVRKAFVHCLNYEELVYAIFNTEAMGTDMMTSMLMPGTSYKADIGKYDYNPELSKELLAASGYSVDNPVHLKLVTSSANYQDRIAEMMQAYGKEVGIEIELDTLKSSGLKEAKDGLAVESEYDILINTGDFANGSPTGAFAGMDVWGMDAGTYNPMKGVMDEQFHEKYAQAERTLDESERAALYEEIQQMFFDNVWFLPLMPDVQMAAFHPWVSGVTFSSGYNTYWGDLRLEA